MPRQYDMPAQTVREDIRQIEEVPATPNNPGVIRVHVGRVDVKGDFLVPQNFDVYEVRGGLFSALTADEAPDWAVGKPPGTYRNTDLWYCIDKIRDAQVRAAALQRELNGM